MPDPLDNARPLRLSLMEGAWSLEFESLERVSHVVFNPVVYTVEGQEPILAALERMGAGESLVALAHQLFDQNAENPQEKLRFEPKDDAWIPAASDQFSFARRSPPQSSDSTARRLAARRKALKRNLAKIGTSEMGGSTSIEALERRVVDLEAQLRELASSGLVEGVVDGRTPSKKTVSESNAKQGVPELAPIPGPDILKQQPSEDVSESANAKSEDGDVAESDDGDVAESEDGDVAESEDGDAAESDDGDAAESDDGDAAESEDGDVAESEDGDAAESDKSSEELEEEPPHSLVVLPTRQKVQSTLQMLVGNEMSLQDVSPEGATILSSVTTKLFVSSLVDDTGSVVGAMVTDLVATIHIGGGLLMMPSAVLEEQIEAGTPDQDILESLSEVFNTTGALINESSENPHVRTQSVEALDFDSYSWIETSPLKVEFEDEHGGRLIIASREP